MSSEEWIVVKKPEHEFDGMRWVAIIAEIRDNETLEIREYVTQEILNDGEDAPSTFMWEHGNYSCDCNRSLFFSRAADEPEDEDRECSDGAYSVRLRNAKTDNIYYAEF